MAVRQRVKYFVISLSRSTLILSTVISATSMALILNSVQSIIWWGFISKDLLVMGTIDAIIIAFILAPLIVMLVSRLTSLEKEIASKKIIEKSERRYKLIAENVNDVVWILDAESQKLVYTSPSVFKQRGFTFQEALNQSLDQIFAQESVKVVKQILSEEITLIRSNEDSRNINLELKQLHKDGSKRWVEIDAHMIKNTEDGRIEVVGVSRDIAQRKKIEGELRIYQEQLEKLVEQRTLEIKSVNNQLREEIEREIQIEELLKESLAKEKAISELKGHFVSTTSHEFRTPLTAMLSSAEMMKRYDSTWTKEKKGEHLDKIIRSIQNMVVLLDEIIAYSKTDTGKTKLNRTKLNVEEVSRNLIEDALIIKKDKHIFSVNFQNIQENYNLDENVIRTVLNNLLVNAFKYSPDGGNVSLNVRGFTEFVEFTVKDEGLGIPENDLNYLFEPFYRASNSANIQGSGLGLSIVKKSVDLHGGKINVKSKEGIGTEFKVQIPIYHEQEYEQE